MATGSSRLERARPSSRRECCFETVDSLAPPPKDSLPRRTRLERLAPLLSEGRLLAGLFWTVTGSLCIFGGDGPRLCGRWMRESKSCAVQGTAVGWWLAARGRSRAGLLEGPVAPISVWVDSRPKRDEIGTRRVVEPRAWMMSLNSHWGGLRFGATAVHARRPLVSAVSLRNVAGAGGQRVIQLARHVTEALGLVRYSLGAPCKMQFGINS